MMKFCKDKMDAIMCSESRHVKRFSKAVRGGDFSCTALPCLACLAWPFLAFLSRQDHQVI